MKQIKYIFVIIIAAFALISCSSDSDNNPAGSSGSQLDGTWKMGYSLFSSNLTVSLEVNVNLTFNNGQISGTGVITYSRDENGTQTNVTIQDDITGSYNDPNVNVTVTDGTTGYKFNYVGSWEDQNSSFNGIAKVTVGDNVYTHEDLSFFIDSNN
jgi:hypothetical protein